MADCESWDALVERSRNGTFLFRRGYMDYHSDRFEDHSLVFRDRTGKVSSVLPACRRGSSLESHAGLTFGGLVSDETMTLVRMLEVFEDLLAYLRDEGFTMLRYRPSPPIYHRAPAQEDLYALIRLGGRLSKRATLSVLDSRRPGAVQGRRLRGIRKAEAAGLSCRESADLAGFWSLLAEVLQTTYGARPVHSFEEISLLQGRFSKGIRLFGCFRAETLLAGVLIYDSPNVARAQYIASSEEGRRFAALDLLFAFLLRHVYRDKPYFDLGTSESGDGLDLNHGVLEYKESLGARAVTLDTYELPIAASTV